MNYPNQEQAAILSHHDGRLLALVVAGTLVDALLRLARSLADGARENLISRHSKHFLTMGQKLASWSELSRLATNPISL
jgi:hypothetical protein